MIKKLLRTALVVLGALVTAQAMSEPMKIVSLKEDLTDESPSICAKFNRPLAQISTADMPQFFKVQAKGTKTTLPPLLRQTRNELCALNLEYGTEYTLYFMHKISADGGGAMSHDETWHMRTSSLRPQFSIMDDLSSNYRNNTHTIDFLVRSINIKQMRMALFTIPDEEIAAQIHQDEYKSAIGIDKAAKLLQSGARLIDSVLITPAGGINVPLMTKATLHYQGVLQNTPIVVCFDPKLNLQDALRQSFANSAHSIWGAQLLQNKTLNVVINRRNDELSFEVHSAKNALPLKNARIRLYSATGALLNTVESDYTGHAAVSSPETNDPQKIPNIAIVEADEGSSRVRIPAGEVDASLYDVGPNINVYGILAVTDKINYDPKDVIHYLAVSRAPDLKNSGVESYLLRIVSPSGAPVRELKLEDQGCSSFFTEFTIPSDAQSGDWSLKLYDAAGKLVSVRHVNVKRPEPSDFTIKASAAQEALVPGYDEFINLKTFYQDGAPASGLSADAWLFSSPDRTPFSGRLKDYEVGPDPKKHSKLSISHRFDLQQTDEHGSASFGMRIADPGYPVTANFAAMFQDSAGRSEYYTHRYQITASSNIVGLRYDEGQNCIFARMFSPKGKNVAGLIKYNIYRIEPLGVFERSPVGWYFENRRTKIAVKSGALTLSAGDESTGRIEIPPQSGEYFITATTQRGLTTEYTLVHDFKQDTVLEGTLRLKLPPKVTWPGAPADVAFESPFDGSAVIEIISSSGISRQIMDVRRGSNHFSVALSKDLGRQAKIHLTAFFPRSERGIMRARATAMLNIERTDADLSPRIIVTEPAVAGKNLNVSLAIQGSTSKSYYATVAQVLDDHDHVLDGLYIKNRHDTLSERTVYSSGVTASDFTRGSISVPVPSQGSLLKFRTVFWNKDGVICQEKTLPIIKQSQAEIEVPAVVNANDTVLSSVFITNNSSNDQKNFRVKVSCSGTVQCLFDRNINLIRGSQQEFLVPVSAKNEHGSGYLKVDMVNEGRVQSEIRKIDVRIGNPIVRTTDVIPIARGESAGYKVEEGLFPRHLITAELAPVPYLNRQGFTEALQNATYTDDYEKYFALATLIRSNFVSVKGQDGELKTVNIKNHNLQNSKLKPFLQDQLDYLASKLDENGHITTDTPLSCNKNITLIKAASALKAGLNHGLNVNSRLADGLMDDVIEIANGTAAATAYEQAEALWVMLQEDLVTQAKPLIAKLAQKKNIKSPAALAIMAILVHKTGDRRQAIALLERARGELEQLNALREQARVTHDRQSAHALMQEIESYKEPVYSSSCYDAAVLLNACTALHDDTYQTYAVGLLNKNRYILMAQVHVVATLLSQLNFVQEKDLVCLEYNVDNPAFTIKNTQQNARFATVVIKSNNEGLDEIDQPFPFKADIHLTMKDRKVDFLRKINLNLGDEALLVLTVTGDEDKINNLRLYIPEIPGLSLERFLTVNEPRFKRVLGLYPVRHFQKIDNTYIIGIEARRSKRFRIAAIMRATSRGTFSIPRIRLSDADGYSAILRTGSRGYLTIE